MDKKIEDIIETLKKEIISLKNIIDSKEAQIFTYKGVNEDHRKLNGQLRKEIDELNGSWKKYNETHNKLKKKKLIDL